MYVHEGLGMTLQGEDRRMSREGSLTSGSSWSSPVDETLFPNKKREVVRDRAEPTHIDFWPLRVHIQACTQTPVCCTAHTPNTNEIIQSE